MDQLRINQEDGCFTWTVCVTVWMCGTELSCCVCPTNPISECIDINMICRRSLKYSWENLTEPLKH